MKAKLKTLLSMLVLALVIILIKSCAKNSSSSTSCQSKADAIIPAKFESSLGGVNFNTEVFYTSITKNECEIGLANSVSKEKFTKISLVIEHTLGIPNFPLEKAIAFTIYRNGGLHNDSSVLLKDVIGIARYYTKNNKLFHQLFVKNITSNSFIELKDLYAEVDGVIFNYMHAIGRGVLKMQSPSTAFFFKTEEARGLYSHLKNPHDDLKWKLKIYAQKMQLQNLHTSKGIKNHQQLERDYSYGGNCGAPCTKSNGAICRNGDNLIQAGSANCGPDDAHPTCDLAYTYYFIKDNKDVNSENLRLNDGGTATLESCINLDNFRKFRDSVLYNSSIGIKYIEYYYMLSDRLINTIDLPTALQTAMVAYDVNKSINALMDNTSNPDAILVTHEFKAELLEMLNLYKSQTTDEDALKALDEIKSDVNSLEGKTLAEVRRLLNM